VFFLQISSPRFIVVMHSFLLILLYNFICQLFFITGLIDKAQKEKSGASDMGCHTFEA